MISGVDITVLNHSAIRLEAAGKVVWIDPYGLEQNYRDADVVFITHAHYDHFSPDDIKRVKTGRTVFVMPSSMMGDSAVEPYLDRTMGMKPGYDAQIKGIDFETVAAYNTNKDFHPKENEWLGYIITLAGQRIYITGDTDITPESEGVSCDILLLPVGGTYTMDASEAAHLAEAIVPQIAIPIHYGSVAGTPEDGAVFAQNVDNAIQVQLLLGA